MKKLISLTLALVMVMALSITAFADNYALDPSGTSAAKEVYVNFESAKGADKVYQVVVTWEIQDGVYTITEKYQWNPTELKYTNASESSAALTKAPGANIKIQNRSNSDVQYTLQFNFINDSPDYPTCKVSSGSEIWTHSSGGNGNINKYKGGARQTLQSAAPADYSTEKQDSAPSVTIPVVIAEDGDGDFDYNVIEYPLDNGADKGYVGKFVLTLYPA